MNENIISTIVSINYIEKYISSEYTLSKIIDCKLLQSSTNLIYEIQTSSQKYIFKIYKYNSKSLSDINFEKNFVSYLNKNGINTSIYVSNIQGSFISEMSFYEGARYAILTTYANGIELTYDNREDAFFYGVNMAKLHKTSKNFKPTIIKNIDIKSRINTSIKTINIFLKSEYQHELKYFQYFFKILLNKFQNLDMNDFNKVFCHGDLHGGNAHKLSSTITLFDFDFSGYGLIVYDISVFKWRCMIMKEKVQWKDFLKGYQEVIKLNNRELKYLLIFVAIHDLWVMHSYIKRTETMGSLYINKFYIKQRIDFLKKIEKQI
jgi:Ser/Thr protein kinase RdoA (MazF antagonist)